MDRELQEGNTRKTAFCSRAQLLLQADVCWLPQQRTELRNAPGELETQARSTGAHGVRVQALQESNGRAQRHGSVLSLVLARHSSSRHGSGGHAISH